MPKGKGKRSQQARRWGTRFDAISARTADTASVTSADTTTSASTTTTDKAPDTSRASESVFSDGDAYSTASRAAEGSSTVAADNSGLYSEADLSGWDASVNASWGADTTLDEDRSRNRGNDRSFSSTTPQLAQSNFAASPLPPRRLQRWNHNASVFVASLPPEPNAELDTYLRDTLGKHGNILNIKFIHDVRAGNSSNCAFVQFEVSHSQAWYHIIHRAGINDQRPCHVRSIPMRQPLPSKHAT